MRDLQEAGNKTAFRGPGRLSSLAVFVRMQALLISLLITAPFIVASAGPDPRPYKSYEYTDADKILRLVVPEGLALVRGLLVVGPYSGGDSRDYHQQVWYREFLHLHG